MNAKDRSPARRNWQPEPPTLADEVDSYAAESGLSKNAALNAFVAAGARVLKEDAAPASALRWADAVSQAYGAGALLAATASGDVWIVDAKGRRHPISANLSTHPAEVDDAAYEALRPVLVSVRPERAHNTAIVNLEIVRPEEELLPGGRVRFHGWRAGIGATPHVPAQQESVTEVRVLAEVIPSLARRY